MTLELSTTTIEMFEERMALRRKMLARSGVHLGKGPYNPALEREIRDSILNCYNCNAERQCRAWLAQKDGPEGPPSFCPNHDSLQWLKTLQVTTS